MTSNFDGDTHTHTHTRKVAYYYKRYTAIDIPLK
jgi:hypothetical protein